MSSDTLDKQYVLDFFSQLGLNASAIPETQSQTPDILVSGDTRDFLVEIKTRQDSNEWSRALKRGVAETSIPWGAGPWAFTQAAKAYRQFNDFDSQRENLWLMWLSVRREALSRDAFEQIMDSLLGVRHVYVAGEDGSTEMKRCLHAQESVFSKYKNIVGTVVSCGDRISPFANEMSPDINDFENTATYRGLAKQGSLNSISTLSARGFLVFDGDPKIFKSETALEAFLANKYGYPRVMLSEMTAYSGSVLV